MVITNLISCDKCSISSFQMLGGGLETKCWDHEDVSSDSCGEIEGVQINGGFVCILVRDQNIVRISGSQMDHWTNLQSN